MTKQTATKAWAGAASGVLIAFLTLITNSLSAGELQPAALSQLGVAVGVLVEASVMAAIGYVTVYLSPRNTDIEE